MERSVPPLSDRGQYPAWLSAICLAFALNAAGVPAGAATGLASEGGGRPGATEPGRDPVVILSEASRDCLSCHESEGMSVVFADGTEADVHVDPERFALSVHAQAGLDCEACHGEVGVYPHPDVAAPSYQAWKLEQQHTCAGCHSEGEEFDLGVHGRSLSRGDPDVPGCTTCHDDAHAVASAETVAFRRSMVAKCASCHGNDELMRGHGVMTGTVSSYLADFHGLTFQLLQDGGAPSVPVATCSDCHGAHRILPPGDPDSSVYVTNLPATCRRCHEEAGDSFATAWSMHRSPDSHPLVAGIAWFYRIVTAVSVIGFAGYIGLELAHRRRGRGGE